MCYLLDEKNLLYVLIDVKDMDIIDVEKIMVYIIELKLDVIFYCVVYIVVDKVEDEVKELDEKINVDGIRNVVFVVKVVNV